MLQNCPFLSIDQWMCYIYVCIIYILHNWIKETIPVFYWFLSYVKWNSLFSVIYFILNSHCSHFLNTKIPQKDQFKIHSYDMHFNGVYRLQSIRMHLIIYMYIIHTYGKNGIFFNLLGIRNSNRYWWMSIQVYTSICIRMMVCVCECECVCVCRSIVIYIYI